MLRKGIILSVVAGAAVGLCADSARASVLLVNFGITAVNSSQLTNSPGYATGAWNIASPTWNLETKSDSSSLTYADDTTATGVALQLAANAGTSGNFPQSVTFGGANEPSSSSGLGSNPFITGDYNSPSNNSSAGQSPATGGIFQTNTGLTSAVAANITGLTVGGTYSVFVTGRNTNSDTAGISEGASISASNPGSSAYSIPSGPSNFPLTIGNSINYGNSSWVSGNQYVEASVTTSAADPDITIVVEGNNTVSNGEPRGFLNSIEIVQTASAPEPGTLGFIALASGLLITRRRRAVNTQAS